MVIVAILVIRFLVKLRFLANTSISSLEPKIRTTSLAYYVIRDLLLSIGDGIFCDLLFMYQNFYW